MLEYVQKILLLCIPSTNWISITLIFRARDRGRTNQRINIAFARQCNTTNVPSQSQPFWCLSRLAATSAVLHHPIRNGDRRYEHLSVQQACQRGPDQWSQERIFSIHLCTHIICMCDRSFHTFHVGIGSRIQRPWVNPGRKTWNCSAVRDRVSPPKSDTVRESNGQSKSSAQWSEAKQPRRALCPSQTLKDFKGAPLWATLHNQLKLN